METVSVTFDRIFDVVQMNRNRALSTQFGFEAGPLKKYAVAVPGKPELEVGMTVTVVLKRPGDWQSVLGWVNHRTGEIACWPTAAAGGYFMASFMGMLWAADLWNDHPAWSALIIVVAACFLMNGIDDVRDAERAHRVLMAKRDEWTVKQVPDVASPSAGQPER
ncbi:hypothetical protein AACH06_18805 [Ideonella sp. DXS29W]|uniref:Transmembrane protein n=1 Tax=Ideonella lacteola TaxID=2984193 RepID=A0ABU9BSC9_9BURK